MTKTVTCNRLLTLDPGELSTALTNYVNIQRSAGRFGFIPQKAELTKASVYHAFDTGMTDLAIEYTVTHETFTFTIGFYMMNKIMYVDAHNAAEALEQVPADLRDSVVSITMEN